MKGYGVDESRYFDLSEYELHRKPHKPLDDDIEMTLPFNALLDNMKCAICLSIISETQTTQECLHRFCGPCITKSIQFFKKECPTCREKVPSHRSLRPDSTFDKLVAAIYPDKQSFERRQDEVIKRVRESTNHKALVESYRQGVQTQDDAKRKFRLVQPRTKPWSEVKAANAEYLASVTTGGGAGPAAVDTSSRSHKRARMDAAAVDRSVSTSSMAPLQMPHISIEVVLRPHPADHVVPRLSHPYISAPDNCTIAHLRDYIQTQFERLDTDFFLGVRTMQNGYVKQRAQSTLKGIFHRLPDDEKQMCFVVYYTTNLSLFRDH